MSARPRRPKRSPSRVASGRPPAPPPTTTTRWGLFPEAAASRSEDVSTRRCAGTLVASFSMPDLNGSTICAPTPAHGARLSLAAHHPFATWVGAADPAILRALDHLQPAGLLVHPDGRAKGAQLAPARPPRYFFEFRRSVAAAEDWAARLLRLRIQVPVDDADERLGDVLMIALPPGDPATITTRPALS